jgi:hypothetical protein
MDQQALEPTAYIYEGVWRNLSKGTAGNLTLTLSPKYSVFLTNALALFVAMSGGQLWTIIRFSLHQMRSTSKSDTSSKMHNHQQVVLRNATTDIATARLMLNLAWMSFRSGRDAITTCLTIMVLAALNAAFFMVAGTFSNSLVNAGSAVLSRSPYCGFWNQTYFDIVDYGNNPTNAETFTLSTEYTAKGVSDMQLNLEYARACYMSQPSWYWNSDCDMLPRSRLNWTMRTDAGCPFDNKVCSKDSGTISFDTGFISSHDDLGINAVPSERLRYRRVTECTVLNDTTYTTDFETQTKGAGVQPSLQVAYANYGPSSVMNTDFTYSYSNFKDFYTNYTGEGTTPYQIGSTFAFGYIPEVALQSASTFTPIPELDVDNADVFLLFLGFTGKFTEPIEDPWFSAHQHETHDTSFEILQNLYTPDKPISTLGCTEQHQICTASKCSGLLGFDQVQQDIRNRMRLSPNQNITLDRIVRSMTFASMFSVVQNIAKTSSPVLAINSTATGSFTASLPLPVNQWHLELERWHSVAMATLQRTVVEYGTGQIAPQVTDFVPPRTPSEKWICQNLRINSNAYQSFSLVALIVIVIFGALIILVSLRIEFIVGYFQQRWGRGTRGRDMWDDHDMLGRGRWRRAFDSSVFSRHIFSPHIHVSSPTRHMELGDLQTRFSPMAGHSPTGHSPKRASSQALSTEDEIRTFHGSGSGPSPNQSSPSPPRSTFTADFCFDFGTQEHKESSKEESPVNWEKKSLPEIPMQEKAFVIDRGNEASSPPAYGAQVVANDTSAAAEPAVGSGPGRWAYYSAHKRRYGPRLAAPVHHVPSPRFGGLRGNFDNKREGNWI